MTQSKTMETNMQREHRQELNTAVKMKTKLNILQLLFLLYFW